MGSCFSSPEDRPPRDPRARAVKETQFVHIAIESKEAQPSTPMLSPPLALGLLEMPIPAGLIPTLEVLGCEVSVVCDDDPLLKFYPDSALLIFYEIRKHGRQRAKLGIYRSPASRLQSTRLYVYHIWTDSLLITLGGQVRIKGHQLLMAFWTHTLGRDPEMLRRLYFESVLEEETIELLRQQICPRLGRTCSTEDEGEKGMGERVGVDRAPWRTIDIYRPYSGPMHHRKDAAVATAAGKQESFATEDEVIMWGLLVGQIGAGSQAVKIAVQMCHAYSRRDEYTGDVQVERVTFRPQMQHDYARVSGPMGYDLEVYMGLEDSLVNRSSWEYDHDESWEAPRLRKEADGRVAVHLRKPQPRRLVELQEAPDWRGGK